MKICVDAREFVRGRTTGIGRYLEALVASIQNRDGLALLLCVHDLSAIPATLNASSVRRVALPHGPTPFIDQIILSMIAARSGAEIFFSPYYKVPLSGPFRKVITVHDIMFVRLPEFSLPRRMISGLQLRLAVSATDIILVDSEFTRSDLSSFLPGIARKIRVLYPTLDPAWLEAVNGPDMERVRTKYALQFPYLLYVGNFKPHKNVDLLVRAFHELQRNNRTSGRHLLLVGGDAGNTGRISSLVSTLGMAGIVHILRDVPDADLRALYKCADWFVTISGYEGFGYPVLEAMATGCPVIYNPCTSLPEIAGDVGYRVDDLSPTGVSRTLAAAMELRDDHRSRLIALGRKQAGIFVPGTSPELFLSLLANLP